MNAKLSEIYYDPTHPASFGTVSKLYRAMKFEGFSYTRKEIEKWLASQKTHTLFQNRKSRYPTRKTIARNIGEHAQADLADTGALAKFNSGTKFLLVVLDCFSGYCHVQPLKNKSAAQVKRAFKIIFSGKKAVIPLAIGTDKGSEFRAREVQQYFKQLGVHHFTLQNRPKASLAERLIKSIRQRIGKFLAANKTKRYINSLQKIVTGQNNSYHRVIKMAPSMVTLENAAQVYKNIYGHSMHDAKVIKMPVKGKFKEGESVLISKFKRLFEKGHTQTL